MRISEFCDLAIRDLDFENGVINIDHQLQKTRNMKYVIESTKPTSGKKLPMTDEIKDVCLRIVKNRKKQKREPMIDGYGGFLLFGEFCLGGGNPLLYVSGNISNRKNMIGLSW